MSRLPSPDAVLDAALRARSSLRWGAGGAIAAARYLRRTTQVERHERTLPGSDPGPVDRPAPGDPAALQRRADGVGASVRRLYAVRVRDPRLGPAEVIDAIARDPNLGSPYELARFVKTRGLLGEMRPGDEYVVWLPGPWNGPVRVADRTATAIRLVTLRGHMEAGEIEFRATGDGGDLVFEIESAARSGTTGSWLVYALLRLGREVQLHMWAQFCSSVARLAGGTTADPVTVRTTRYPDDHGGLSRPASRRAMRAFARLQGRRVNFDPAELAGAGAPGSPWTVDDHRTPLPPERPGPPAPGGSWETARGLVRDYAFAPPSLIRAVHRPADDLEGRNMLLEGRFLGLRFMLGARVAAVVDGEREIDGRPARVWGWHYQTLEGHLERGQMDFEVVKWPDDGTVAFLIHAVSRPARIPNPVVRLGFRLFGRRLQLRFAREAGERMRRLVGERLADDGPDRPAGPPTVTVPRATGADGPDAIK
jgi:uncharacterized protein (UPF0548 family)